MKAWCQSWDCSQYRTRIKSVKICYRRVVDAKKISGAKRQTMSLDKELSFILQGTRSVITVHT